MTAQMKILAALSESPLCDDCLSEACTEYPRQQVNQRCAYLLEVGHMKREKAPCPKCGKWKFVNSIEEGAVERLRRRSTTIYLAPNQVEIKPFTESEIREKLLSIRVRQEDKGPKWSSIVPPTSAAVFGDDIYVAKSSNGTVSPSEKLAALLIDARNMYAWPKGESPAASQKRIIDLETETRQRIEDLDSQKAHQIVQLVSIWAGNNALAQRNIDTAILPRKIEFEDSIRRLLVPSSIKGGLESLAIQKGIRLVMATKIYRFCSPDVGAALDRHSSYFFNSLPVNYAGRVVETCTRFKREWWIKRRTSRLAAYTPRGHEVNFKEYLDTYLPLMAALAESLNRQGCKYLCAASSLEKKWRPADVEMAAYHWWSRHGPS